VNNAPIIIAAAVVCLLVAMLAGRAPDRAAAPFTARILAVTVEIQLRHHRGPREHYGFAERRQRSRYA
jgi:hypothetical protein